jgi:hypothetical protein
MNKRFLLTLVCVGILVSLILTLKGNCEAKNDDVLYFHGGMLGGYVGAWLMDVNFPNGTYDQFRGELGLAEFVSPPLPQDFYFSGGTVEIFHEKPNPERGTYTLHVSFSCVDVQGHAIPISMPFTKEISYGSTVTYISGSFTPFKLFSGESILIDLTISGSYGNLLNMYWGNATYLSNLSYSGQAFIPELSWQAVSVFMVTSFVVVAIFKLKSKKLAREETS